MCHFLSKQTTETHFFTHLNGKWIKLGVVKCLVSKLNTYPDIRKAEVTSILNWTNG